VGCHLRSNGDNVLKTNILTVFFLFLCGISSFAQTGWILQPSAVKGDLIAVFFTSSDKAWIAGDDGFWASTKDGGKTWAKYELGAS